VGSQSESSCPVLFKEQEPIEFELHNTLWAPITVRETSEEKRAQKNVTE